MKKLSIALIALLAFGTVLGAQSFTAAGSVTSGIGLDLDNMTSGLDVTMDNVRFGATIGEGKAITKEGEGMYGFITIGNLRIATVDSRFDGTAYQDNGTTPAPTNINGINDWGSLDLVLRWDQLKANLYFNPNVNLTLWSFSSYASYGMYGGLDTNWGFLQNAYDYSVFTGLYGNASNDTAAQYNTWDMTNTTPNNRTYFKAHNFLATTPAINDSIQLNVSIPSVVDLSTKVSSWKSYSDSSRWVPAANGSEVPEGDNAYAFSVQADLTAVENLTFKAIANFDLGYMWYTPASPLSFGVLAGYKLKIGEDITINPKVAFDGQMPEYDSINLTPEVKKYDGFDFGIAGGVTVEAFKSKLVANVGYAQNNSLDDPLTTTVNERDNSTSSLRYTISGVVNAVPNLTLKGAYEFIDDDLRVLTFAQSQNDTMAGTGEVSYDIALGEKGTLAPYAKGSIDNKYARTVVRGGPVNPGSDNFYDCYAKAGVQLKGLIANTVVDLGWNTNDLFDFENSTATEVLGSLVLKATVSF